MNSNNNNNKNSLCEKRQMLIVLFLLVSCWTAGGDDDVEQVTDPGEEEMVTVGDVNSLTEEKCGKKRKGCCEELYLGNEESLNKCFVLHQGKLPPEGDNDPSKLMKFMSCFVECLYKQKKYLGKGDAINMKMVRKDANKTFIDRPKEKDYHIEMFDFCRKDGFKTYNLIKSNPAGKALIKDTCRPYFMFVFLCQAEYHQKQRCPYFRWEGKRKSAAVNDCKDAKEKCYEIDGIEPH